MTKKLLVLFTVICVMASMLVIPGVVYADYTNRWTDSFEEGSGSVYASLATGKAGAATTDAGYYYASAGDGLLITTDTAGSGVIPWTNSVKWDPTGGYNGTGGLYIFNSGTNSSGAYRGTSVATRAVTLEENTAVVLRYKIKFITMEDTSALNAFFLSGVTGNNTVSNNSKTALNESAFSWETGKWYTVVTKVTGTTAAKTTTTYILNEDNTVNYTGTKDITITVDTANYTEATQPIYLWPVVTVQNTLAKQLMLDNISLTKYTTDSTQAISFDESGSNIKSGETGVVVNKTFRLSFDHDLASGAADTVKLYKASDTKKTSPVACAVSASTYDGFSLTPDNTLELNTEYILDFSGVTSSAGAAVATSSQSIRFKTVDPGETPIEPVKFVSAAASGGAFTDGAYQNAALKDSFTLTLDSEILEPTYGTDVNLYKTADTSKTTIAATLTMSDDAKSFTLTPTSNLSLGTNYTIDFSGLKTTLGGAVEGTSAVTFTTISTRDTLYLADNLETVTLEDSANYKTSDILEFNSYVSSTYVKIKDGVGYEGSKGIVCDNSANTNATVSFATKGFDLDERERLFIEFKFKINSAALESTTTKQVAYFMLSDTDRAYPNSGFALFKVIRDGDTGAFVLKNNGEGNSYSYDTNKWYTMLMSVGRTGQNGYIFDEDGNMVFEASLGKTFSSSVKFTYSNVTKVGSNVNLNIDNFKAYRVQSEALSLNTIHSNIYDGMTGAPTNASLVLNFNQPFAKNMKAEEVFALYEGDSKVTATIERVGGNEIRITPAESLKQGRTYSVKFPSAALLLGSNSVADTEISFTTKTIYNVNALSSTIAKGSDGTLAAGEVALIVDNIGEALENLTVVLAVYGEERLSNLLGWEKVAVKTLASGENTIKINISKNYSDVGYAEFLMYDNTSTLKPLMKGFKVVR